MNYQEICAIILIGANLAAASSDIEAWNKFKTKYDKDYTSKAEEELRRKVFLENKRKIDDRYKTKSAVSFVQGINSLSDLTTEEINKSRNGFRPSKRTYEPMDALLEVLLMALNETSGGQLPSKVRSNDKAWYENILSTSELDWRLTGRVSKVKEQGSCGSCYAFSITGALEGILASRNKSALLSEQNIIDCSRTYGNLGCSGGYMEAGMKYVRDHGIMLARDYPYTGTDDNCCKIMNDRSVMQIKGSVNLPRGNEPLLRLALSLTGPIPIAIDSSLPSFHAYKSGIYDDRECKTGRSNVNHAVLLVGYGTDPIYGDYWIVKNSWGKNWGEDGYIRMARNRRNLCGIASYAVLPIP